MNRLVAILSLILVMALAPPHSRAEDGLVIGGDVYTGGSAPSSVSAQRDAFAEGITVNLVSPGYTLTQRTRELLGKASESETQSAIAAVAADIPTRRFADADEIGAVVAFLCSQPAAFVNGVNLVVDGAHTRGI